MRAAAFPAAWAPPGANMPLADGDADGTGSTSSSAATAFPSGPACPPPPAPLCFAPRDLEAYQMASRKVAVCASQKADLALQQSEQQVQRLAAQLLAARAGLDHMQRSEPSMAVETNRQQQQQQQWPLPGSLQTPLRSSRAGEGQGDGGACKRRKLGFDFVQQPGQQAEQQAQQQQQQQQQQRPSMGGAVDAILQELAQQQQQQQAQQQQQQGPAMAGAVDAMLQQLAQQQQQAQRWPAMGGAVDALLQELAQQAHQQQQWPAMGGAVDALLQELAAEEWEEAAEAGAEAAELAAESCASLQQSCAYAAAAAQSSGPQAPEASPALSLLPRAGAPSAAAQLAALQQERQHLLDSMFACPAWASQPRYAALMHAQAALRQQAAAAAACSAAHASGESHLAAAAGCLLEAVQQLKAAGLTECLDPSSTGNASLLRSLYTGGKCSRRAVHRAYLRHRRAGASLQQQPHRCNGGVRSQAVQEAVAQQAALYVQQAARQVQTALGLLPTLPCLPQAAADLLASGLFLDLFSGEHCVTEAAIAERVGARLAALNQALAQISACQAWCASKAAQHAQHATSLQVALQLKQGETEKYQEAAVAAALRRGQLWEQQGESPAPREVEEEEGEGGKEQQRWHDYQQQQQ